MPAPREYTCLFAFSGIGAGARGFLEARLPSGAAQFKILGGIDLDPRACEDFERLTGAPAWCTDLARVTGADLRARYGDVAPDVIFLSPPCKRATYLVTDATAATPESRAMNRLMLDFLRAVAAAWPAQPPRLILVENVPGIEKRAADVLGEVKALLRARGFVFHEGFHDCGELGALAQRRRRWLMVARHAASTPQLLYQPPKRKVRACGEVLSRLPLPGDPRAGRLHQLPRIAPITWIRLALIPAGGDWQDLPGMQKKAASKSPKGKRFNNVYTLRGWTDPMGAVTGGSGPSCGGQSVADPRIAFFRDAYNILIHTGPGPAPKSARGMRVVDPRLVAEPNHAHVYGVLDPAAPAHTITSAASPGCGPFSIADDRLLVVDPRVNGTPHADSYGVLDAARPAGAVTGKSSPTCGPFAVADGRFANSLRVGAWDDAAGAVTGKPSPASGGPCVADPRLNIEAHNGVFGVLAWDAPAGAITGAKYDSGAMSIADPRVPEVLPLSLVGSLDKELPFPLVILALDGTWHRPLTALECAWLQGVLLGAPGWPSDLAGSLSSARERIGQCVPVPTAEAIAQQMLLTLVNADAGVFSLSGGNLVWVESDRGEPVELGSVQ